MQFEDKTVLEKIEQEFHPIAVPSKDPNDKIKGILFEISTDELKKVDLC
ncbi:hypothetical protein Q2T40_16390 [Winogradskyella maritima]|uniref:Gamma-glutamylcyclotransferase AIG2-like domain-containing protein n=1 Tax=Winogradskyella maritima TaxID=1517766 RepID=A0ABV8AEZ9_9FLAO|nr:hypothetical protein [Winogradskyella maritima]